MNQSAWETGGPNAAQIPVLESFSSYYGAIFLPPGTGMSLLSLNGPDRGIQQTFEPLRRPSRCTESTLRKIVAMATGITVVILFGLIVVSVAVGMSVSKSTIPSGAMIIETGTQWWWKIRYWNDDPSGIFAAADAMHIPIDHPIAIRGSSNDVIHSFWVPGLQGKRDLIPGRTTVETLQADKPGEYRGQCSEFCGLQHAHMAFLVVAETTSRSRLWKQRQLQPAAEPANDHLRRGQQVFLRSACILCHTIRGTPGRTAGPDLTHFASRKFLAAGTLTNTKGNLAGWIADPQNIKPGTRMASVPLESKDMQPLIDYLESLQ